jgi:hypothetical protein
LVLKAPRSRGLLRSAAALRVRPTDRDRRLMAMGVRHGRLVASQAWRWEWPASAGPDTARNRLSELTTAGYFEHLDRFPGEGVYVPTAKSARLVRDLTGGLSEPKVPEKHEGRWLSQLLHDLTVPEAERWLRSRAPEGSRFLTVRELFRERALTLPPAQRRGGAGMGYRPDGVLVLSTGERIAVEVELHDKAERLAEPDGKLADYRAAYARGDYAEVLWLVPDAAVEGPLVGAIERAGCGRFMAVEFLPADVLRYAR